MLLFLVFFFCKQAWVVFLQERQIGTIDTRKKVPALQDRTDSTNTDVKGVKAMYIDSSQLQSLPVTCPHPTPPTRSHPYTIPSSQETPVKEQVHLADQFSV